MYNLYTHYIFITSTVSRHCRTVNHFISSSLHGSNARVLMSRKHWQATSRVSFFSFFLFLFFFWKFVTHLTHLQACFKTCYQSHVIKRCGCASPYLPSSSDVFGSASIAVCDTSNITQGWLVHNCDMSAERFNFPQQLCVSKLNLLSTLFL